MIFTFAELLRGYRQRASLGQASLATALRVHSNTLSSWERGQYRPRYREHVLRLAEELALTSAETGQLLRAADFPPAYGTPDPLGMHHQLRPPVADFIGRAAETEQLVTLLETAATQRRGAIISGVQGMGGVGKTELAYRVAHQLRAAFPDAQIVVALQGSSTTPLTPTQALQAVLRAFVPDEKLPDDLPSLERRYRALLHDRRVLILADDARDATQVQPLTPPSGSALLITSRQRFRLPGMATVDLEQLSAEDSVRLLRAICPRLGAAPAQAIARACGYLPLALRISGGILRNDPALPVAVSIERLVDARQRLTQLRDPDDAQLDVEASLLLSYAQLDAASQQVFRQLGVLVADFATPLALAVVEVPRGVDVAAMLHLLLRRNLIMYDTLRAHWRLHDLVRDLARRLLAEGGETEPVWWRYARAAVQIAQETQEQYQAGGNGALTALARFDTERLHLDAGRRWAMEHAETPQGDQLLLDDAVATKDIGLLRYDARRERIPQWERALAAARRLGDRHAEGQALNNMGTAYLDLGDVRRASEYYEQRLTIARELGDRYGEGQTLNNTGNTYRILGDAHRAIPAYEQALAIARAIDDWRTEGQTLNNMGNAYRILGEARRAISYYEQSLIIARTIGDRRGEGIVLTNLGNTYADLGDACRAIESCEEALTAAREIGGQWLEGYALSYLARAQALQGYVSHVTTAFEQALALFQEVGDRSGEAECRWLFGLALVRQRDRYQALPLLRTAVAYEQEIGHAKAEEHAALLARLEAGEDLPAEILPIDTQRAVGGDVDAPHADDDATDAPTG